MFLVNFLAVRPDWAEHGIPAGVLRVRELMVPRTDLIAIDVDCDVCLAKTRQIRGDGELAIALVHLYVRRPQRIDVAETGDVAPIGMTVGAGLRRRTKSEAVEEAIHVSADHRRPLLLRDDHTVPLALGACWAARSPALGVLLGVTHPPGSPLELSSVA